MSEQLERNKRNAQAFYALMFNDCKPRQAIAQYVGDEYIQHNPHVHWDVLQVIPGSSANDNTMF